MNGISDITNTLNKFATVIADNKAEQREIDNVQKAIQILEAIEDYDTFLGRLDIADAVWAYYLGTKQVGHTDLMMHGVLTYESKAAIIVGGANERSRFDNLEDRLIIPYNRFDQLVGQQIPLAWDNHAIVRIFSSLMMIQGAFRQVKKILSGQNV